MNIVVIYRYIVNAGPLANNTATVKILDLKTCDSYIVYIRVDPKASLTDQPITIKDRRIRIRFADSSTEIVPKKRNGFINGYTLVKCPGTYIYDIFAISFIYSILDSAVGVLGALSFVDNIKTFKVTLNHIVNYTIPEIGVKQIYTCISEVEFVGPFK